MKIKFHTFLLIHNWRLNMLFLVSSTIALRIHLQMARTRMPLIRLQNSIYKLKQYLGGTLLTQRQSELKMSSANNWSDGNSYHKTDSSFMSLGKKSFIQRYNWINLYDNVYSMQLWEHLCSIIKRKKIVYVVLGNVLIIINISLTF